MNENTAGQGPLERQVRRESLCWCCSKAYPETWQHCPRCGSTNANVDFTTALVEMTQRRQDMECPQDYPSEAQQIGGDLWGGGRF
jgi:predicted amidophosphoribosyltransferase